MDSRVKHFLEEIKGKRVTVIGIGVSHSDLIFRLNDWGAKVTACDKRTREQVGQALCSPSSRSRRSVIWFPDHALSHRPSCLLTSLPGREARMQRHNSCPSPHKMKGI